MKKLAPLALLLFCASASAEPFHADVEIDPTAYALDGNSVHVGIGAGRIRAALGNFAERLRQLGVGVHAGYRFELPDGFYVTPWLGVGYDFGTHDVTFQGATYHPSAISVFPAVHVGFRFR